MATALILALSLAFTFPSCSDGSSGGSDNDSEQATNPKATYTVTFDANGGTGTIESITEVAGTEITIPENTLVKEGFEFAGWNTAKNMTGTSYDDGATFTPNSNLTLYAKWTADAANVAESIKSLEAGEHTVSVVGEIDKYKLIKIATAIINNENEVEINLDLSGTTGLTEFPSYVFTSACAPKLTGMVLPKGIVSILKSAFDGIESLKSVVIPDGVESIGSRAFDYCTSLSEAVIPGSVKSIGESAFATCALSEVVIPDSVTEIGTAAFNRSGISILKIGKGLTAIPNNSFMVNNLKKITIPSNVKSIGVSAFNRNYYLTEIVLEEGVETIGEGAFGGNSSLVSVTIPKSVKSIGDNAFGRNGLTVNYNGTVEEWKALITTNTGYENLLNAKVHCSDGDYTPTAGE